MNYFQHIIKNIKSSLILASILFMSLTTVSISHKKVSETNAARTEVHMAIDSSQGIGYLASQQYDFMRMTNYFCKVDETKERTTTIFLQEEWQGSSSYLSDIRSILIVDKISLNNCSYLFEGLENLEYIENLDNIDVSMCNQFEYMFANCPKLKEVDFTGFDVSNCGSFRNMFCDSSFETLDLSGFDTSSCGDFREMFKDCENITSLDLSTFNTKNASVMDYMFSSCPNLEYLDISGFDLSNNPRTEYFFRGTKPKVIVAPKCVPEHKTDNIVAFELPFESMETPYYYDYDLNTYTNMVQANESITYYHHRLIRAMERASESFLILFDDFKDLANIDVDSLMSKWDILSEAYFSIFFPLNEGNEPIYTIFEKCKNDTINVEVGKWLTFYDNVYPTYCHVLKDCGGDFLNRFPDALEPDGLIHIGINTTEKIGYLSSVDSYEILTSDLHTKVDLAGKSMENSIFSFLESDAYEDITKVEIQSELEILNCSNFFKGLENVKTIEGMKKINSESNTTCNSMFENCYKLETIDLGAFNTDNVVTADLMFKNCTSLVEIVSLSFTSKALISISEMFSNCSNLALIDLSNFDLTNVNNSFNCLYSTSPLYIKTPKAMPTKVNCDLNLYFPMGITNFYYYDTSFSTYEKLPKKNESITIISTIGKHVLDDFCDGFKKDAEYYCDKSGNTSEEKLTKLWEDQAKTFNDHFKDSINNCLLEFFEQDNSSSLDNSLKEFSQRYDYIYGKYQTFLDEHGGDFANRSKLISFPSGSSFIGFNHTTSESSVLIICIVSIVSVSTLVYLVYTKKRISAKKRGK